MFVSDVIKEGQARESNGRVMLPSVESKQTESKGGGASRLMYISVGSEKEQNDDIVVLGEVGGWVLPRMGVGWVLT